MVIYEYASVNRLKNPHNYMYTKYNGDDFLRSYKENRIIHINKIKDSQKNETYDQINEYLYESLKIRLSDRNKYLNDSPIKSFNLREDLERVKTKDIILSLISSNLFKEELDQSKKWIDFIVQKFEVSKKIFEFYYPFQRIKGEGKSTIIELYCFFSFLLTIVYENSKNIKYFNTLLKINDLICSLDENQKNEIPKKTFILILENEIKNVEKLYGKEIGV